MSIFSWPFEGLPILKPMTPEERERMNFLCGQIAKEQDHAKFAKLVQELNNLLEQKDQRLEDAEEK